MASPDYRFRNLFVGQKMNDCETMRNGTSENFVAMGGQSTRYSSREEKVKKPEAHLFACF